MPTNRAAQKIPNRTAALQAYQNANGIAAPPAGHLGALTARVSSFANTVQTRLNSSSGTVSALGGTLEAQVDQAISQVMRQPASAQAALKTRPGDTTIATLVGGTNGGQPIMPPYQASMLREARITQADILAVMDILEPLSPFADPGDIASLRAVVQAEVNGLLEEFSYTHLLPRRQRARVFLGGLLGWDFDGYYPAVTSPLQQGAPAGDVQAFVTLLNLGGPLIPTLSVEDQLASQQIVGSDAALFDAQWKAFWTNVSTTPISAFSAVHSPTWLPATSGGWPLWESNFNPAAGTAGPGGLGSLTPTAVIDVNPPAVNGAGVSASLIGFGPQSQQAPWLLPILRNNGTVTPPVSYAEKMIQADLLLPVIAQDASRAENSLTAIGYTTGEQETDFAWLWSAVDADLLQPWTAATGGGAAAGAPGIPWPSSWNVLGNATYLPPYGNYVSPNQLMTPIPVWMTVADILDWAQNLAGASSSDQLRKAGALGLNLLCDQADELFWLVLALLDPTASAQINALADAETQLELFALATDLNQLANLAY